MLDHHLDFPCVLLQWTGTLHNRERTCQLGAEVLFTVLHVVDFQCMLSIVHSVVDGTPGMCCALQACQLSAMLTVEPPCYALMLYSCSFGAHAVVLLRKPLLRQVHGACMFTERAVVERHILCCGLSC